jgi:hypothetical protein
METGGLIFRFFFFYFFFCFEKHGFYNKLLNFLVLFMVFELSFRPEH